MLTTTVGGWVSSKIGWDLVILLQTGSRISVRAENTSLKLGERCHVLFNHTTGEVVKLFAYDELVPDQKAVEPPEKEQPPTGTDNPTLDMQREVLGEQGFEEFWTQEPTALVHGERYSMGWE